MNNGTLKYAVCIAFCALLFICSNSVIAQTKTSLITGKIIDEKGAPVEFATIVLRRGNVITSGCVSESNGSFAIKAQQDGNEYDLSVEFIGYETVSMKINANSNKLDLGSLVLKEQDMLLDGVVVESKIQEKKMAVERTSLNASANMASSKGSVIDLLRGASSVAIGKDNAISIRGKSNILILLDGIPTTVTDLANIPASNLKSVDIITNPDASYDSEGTGGIINIVSKKSTATGFSGMVNANYGFNHFVTGNIAMNYNSGKSSFRFSYNTKYEDDEIVGSLFRKFISTGNSLNQQVYSLKRTSNNNISMGGNFKLNKKNILDVELKLLLPRINTKQDFTNTYSAVSVQSVENRYSDVSWNRENIDGAITFRHIISPDISEFTLKGSISKIWGHRPSYYYLEDELTNKSNSGGSPFNSAVQADFKWKLPIGTLESGVKFTYRRNDIYHEFYTMENGSWTYSTDFSKDLLHQEYIPAAYLLYSAKFKKKFTLKAGLRGEYSNVSLKSVNDKIDQNRGNFFIAPTLSGVFHISENQELALAYSRRIGRPAYPQLNPYMSMIDATTYEQGNMHLKPEKSDNLDLSYSVNKGIFHGFFAGYLNYTGDYITQVSKLSGDNLLLTYINCTSDLKGGLDISLQFKPKRWIDFTLNANTFYSKVKANYEYVDIDNEGWSNNSNVLVNILPSKTTDIQLQYFVSTPQYYPQFTASDSHHMTIGVKQRLLKGRMNLSVLLTDVFNTYKWDIYSYNRIFDLTNISRNKSRMLWLGISYNLNSFKPAKKAQKQEFDRSKIKL